MAESLSVFGAMKGLFEYNRENFIFDRTQNQERVYQIQKMRVSQVKLYREDLRELFALTIRKMDTYLIFNALLLLFTGGLFYEGRLPQGTPAWLLWLWTMSLGSAFLFLSLSIWFAIHASITAQTFQVRLLTQWLRLPIPSAEDIHAVSGAATDFEQGRPGTMLRVPGVNNKKDNFNCTEKYPDVPNELLQSELVEDYTMFVEHFYLFRDLQKHWQGFDGYSRINMVVGTNMLSSAFSYMSLAYFLMSFKNWGGLSLPFILTGFQIIHMKINLRNLSRTELVTMVVLIVLPVLLASVAGVQSVLSKNTMYADFLSPVIYAACGGWIIFLILMGSEDDGGLPCRFVTVGSIDVLGLDEDDDRFQALSPRKRQSPDTSSELSSDREGAETPVALAVPPAAIVTHAEERRRNKSHTLDKLSNVSSIDFVKDEGDVSVGEASQSAFVSDIMFYPSLGPVEEIVEDEIPLSAILDSSLIIDKYTAEQEEAAEEGIGPADQNAQEEVGAFRCSTKVKSLPWRSYREMGAVLVCLWIFATAYSILASFQPRWGWPRTLPHGDGEDETAIDSPMSAGRRLMLSNEDFIFDYEVGKLNIKSTLNGEVRMTVDVVDLEGVFYDHMRGEVVVVEREGDPRTFKPFIS
jgi:hypothetical protein